MDFLKMHGAGNDFVMLDLVDGAARPSDPSRAAVALCDRHKGIGADGLILVSEGDQGIFKMEIFNSDGSEANMCGNGLRCTAKLLVDSGHCRSGPLRIEVGGRVVEVEVVDKHAFRINMGRPELDPAAIGMAAEYCGASYIDQPFEAEGRPWRANAVAVGNPHLVLFGPSLEGLQIERAGPALERNGMFRNGMNVHFACITGVDRIEMKTWERGAGITLACGSGACSVGVSAYLSGITGREVTVDVPGGRLKAEYSESGDVFMEGPAELVYRGNLAPALEERALSEATFAAV